MFTYSLSLRHVHQEERWSFLHVEDTCKVLFMTNCLVLGLSFCNVCFVQAMAALKKRPGDSVDTLVSAARHGTMSVRKHVATISTSPRSRTP